MTDDRDHKSSLLAAEYVLGLLEGDELRAARALAESDAAFTIEVDRWTAHFAPLFDTIAPVAPDPSVWSRIEARLNASALVESHTAIRPADVAASNDDAPDGSGAVVAQLRRKLRAWRLYGAAASALAAALLLVVIPGAIRPLAPPPPPIAIPAASTPDLIANVLSSDHAVAIVIAYNPATKEMIVTPALAHPAPGHDHELWVIPASGKPASLGVVRTDRPTRMVITPERLTALTANSVMAVTVEQPGGSPTGQPSAAPVATGKLTII